MKTLAAAGIALLLLAGLNYWQYTQGQALLTRAVTAEQASAENEAVITTLRAQSTAQSEAVLRLAKQQSQFSDILTDRQQKIRELERENKTYRDWANQQLPDAAKRLRQRPAITGAADYQRYLSTTNPLHPAGSQPDTKRQPDD